MRDLNFCYGQTRALSGIQIGIPTNQVTALIGPFECGKPTFLRCLNRMNHTIPGTSVQGKILLDGEDIYAPEMNLISLRQQVGMVYQKPNPFPQSIFNYAAFTPRALGLTRNRVEFGEPVSFSLQQAARVSDYTGFFWLGELVEFAPTSKIFVSPEKELTETYITGRMG